MFSNKFVETHEPLAKIDPASYATAQSTGWVDCALYERIAALILVGAIAATGTFNAKLEQATSAAGAGAKDITGKAITPLTDADDNKLLAIECKAAELDKNNGFRYVRLTLTPATAATLVGAVLIGLPADYNPVPGTLYTQKVG